MSFGLTPPVDEKDAISKRKLVLHDDGASRLGWSGGVGVDDGIIAGGYLQPWRRTALAWSRRSKDPINFGEKEFYIQFSLLNNA